MILETPQAARTSYQELCAANETADLQAQKKMVRIHMVFFHRLRHAACLIQPFLNLLYLLGGSPGCYCFMLVPWRDGVLCRIFWRICVFFLWLIFSMLALGIETTKWGHLQMAHKVQLPIYDHVGLSSTNWGGFPKKKSAKLGRPNFSSIRSTIGFSQRFPRVDDFIIARQLRWNIRHTYTHLLRVLGGCTNAINPTWAMKKTLAV